MLARLDTLPQRHRSVTLRAAAPEVDFRTSMRCERIPGRNDPCRRNSPSHACHAKPPAIGLSLAEIAGTTRSGQRPARAGPRDWHNACGNCGNPRHGPPARYRDRFEGRAERSETYFSDSRGPHWEEKWHDRRPTRRSSAVWRANGNWRTWVPWCPLTRGGLGEGPASNQKILNLFNAGKPQTPANGAYLFRPSASQSYDRDAQVGMFEIEGLARSQARFGSPVSRPSRSAARPALSAWPAWHPPRPARSSSAQGTAWPAPGSARRPCRRPRRAWRTSAPMD
jgi:hypothetical protein